MSPEGGRGIPLPRSGYPDRGTNARPSPERGILLETPHSGDARSNGVPRMRDMDGEGGRLDLPDKYTDEGWREVQPDEHARRLIACGIALESLPPYVQRRFTLSGDGARSPRADT